MLKLLNFSCSRYLFPGDHSDHFLVNINRMAGEEVAVHDAASGPSRPINYDPDHYGQALEGKRGLADADIAEAARANLALLDSLGGA